MTTHWKSIGASNSATVLYTSIDTAEELETAKQYAQDNLNKGFTVGFAERLKL